MSNFDSNKQFESGLVMWKCHSPKFYVAHSYDESTKLCKVCNCYDSSIGYAKNLREYVEIVLRYLSKEDDYFDSFKVNDQYEYEGLSDDYIKETLDEIDLSRNKLYL